MDKERYTDEKRDERVADIEQRLTKQGKVPPPPEKINYRLIQEWEVP